MLHAALTGEEVVDAHIVGMVLADLAEDLPGVVRSAIARVGEVPPTDPTARLARWRHGWRSRKRYCAAC